MSKIGWKVDRNSEGHWECYPPNRNIQPVIIASHNYENHAQAVKLDILKRSRDLNFLFEDPWDPPVNFNRNTLRIENKQTPTYETKIIEIPTLDRAPADLVPNYDVLIDNHHKNSLK